MQHINLAAPLTAIGLMSGTSLDGVDAAIVVTDGHTIVSRGSATTTPYPADFRATLRRLLGRMPTAADTSVIEMLTDWHADAVDALLQRAGMTNAEIDIIGFHGQTVLHRPQDRLTVQIGDSQRLANRLGIAVVSQLRTADVNAGGQGAPLAPIYHAALSQTLGKPVAVLNIGGVANVTWIGEHAAGTNEPALLAFDTGPGNALIDDWMLARTGRPFDENGNLAATGTVHQQTINRWLTDEYFRVSPPKSLDRETFHRILAEIADLNAADGAATLCAFTAAAIGLALPQLPLPPLRWLVCGGGRHNPTLMAMVAQAVCASVDPVESVGWRGDYLEAEAFAFLAARSVLGLPLSLPTTTGVPAPQTGGQLIVPQLRSRQRLVSPPPS